MVKRLSMIEIIQPEFPGQGSLKLYQEQRVGVYLVLHNAFVSRINHQTKSIDIH